MDALQLFFYESEFNLDAQSSVIVISKLQNNLFTIPEADTCIIVYYS